MVVFGGEDEFAWLFPLIAGGYLVDLTLLACVFQPPTSASYPGSDYNRAGTGTDNNLRLLLQPGKSNGTFGDTSLIPPAAAHDFPPLISTIEKLGDVYLG